MTTLALVYLFFYFGLTIATRIASVGIRRGAVNNTDALMTTIFATLGVLSVVQLAS